MVEAMLEILLDQKLYYYLFNGHYNYLLIYSSKAQEIQKDNLLGI